jgi:hypothetical protein
MVEEALVELDLEAGKTLIDQLAKEGFPLKAAAWVRPSDGQNWRLYLVTPIRNRDFLDSYLRVSEAILADPRRKEKLKYISFNIVDSKEPLGKKLVEWAKNTAAQYQRVSDLSPDGGVIDAVVYGRAA